MFLGLWIATYVIFFSMEGTKLSNYVVPAAPAIAILVGACLRSSLSNKVSAVNGWSLWAGVALTVLGALLTLGVSIAASLYLPGEKLLGLIGFIPMLGKGSSASSLLAREGGYSSRPPWAEPL